MRANKLLIVIVLLLGIGATSCKKKKYACSDENAVNYEPTADFDDGSCEYTGTVVFWKSGLGDVDIFIGGVLIGTVTKNYSSAPNCSSADSCVVYDAESPGTHTYTLRERPPGTHTRTAYFSVVNNTCTKEMLR